MLSLKRSHRGLFALEHRAVPIKLVDADSGVLGDGASGANDPCRIVSPPWVSSGVCIARKMSPSGSGGRDVSKVPAATVFASHSQAVAVNQTRVEQRTHDDGHSPTRSTSLIT